MYTHGFEITMAKKYICMEFMTVSSSSGHIVLFALANNLPIKTSVAGQLQTNTHSHTLTHSLTHTLTHSLIHILSHTHSDVRYEKMSESIGLRSLWRVELFQMR